MDVKSEQPAADDFTVLRKQLHQISQKHYQALWAENGPLSNALSGKFLGQQEFESARPDIKFLHQQGTQTENLTNLTRAFLELNIRGYEPKLTDISHSELKNLNHLLDYISESLVEVFVNCFEEKDSDILSVDQVQKLSAFLQTLIPTDNSTLSEENLAAIVVAFVNEVFAITDEHQRELFFNKLIQARPDLFAGFDYEKIRRSTIRSAIELRTDAEPTFALNQLAKLFAGEIDDFSLFNEAYGLAFTSIDADQKGFSIHDTSYHVHNGVIKTVRLALAGLQESDHPVSRHWEALVTLNNVTTVLNKNINPDCGDNTYPINSLSVLFNWLLNLKEPLLFLQSQQNCAEINTTVNSLYNKSFDEIFKFLYFNKNQQRSLATYFGIPLPKTGFNYQTFINRITSNYRMKKLTPEKREFAKIIKLFSEGRLTHVGFQAEMKKLQGAYTRPDRLLTRIKHYLIAIFTPGWGNFSKLLDRFDSVLYFNKNILPQFKKTRETCEADLAKEAVNAKFEIQGRTKPVVTVQSIRSQDKDKIGELVWLKESIKTQINRLASAVVKPILSSPEQRRALEQKAAAKSNPVYASAYSKLLFLTEQRSKSTPTLPTLESRVPELGTLVNQTVAAHHEIFDSPPSSKPTLPESTNITREKLTQTLTDLQKLNRKAEVRAHLMQELLVEDSRPLVSVF